jgi:hypothetical protein
MILAFSGVLLLKPQESVRKLKEEIKSVKERMVSSLTVHEITASF